jgi:hypothetical protein
MSDFEFLRAYVEARNVAYADLRLVKQTAERISRGVPRTEMTDEEKRTADLLGHLGLAVASLEGGLTYRPPPSSSAWRMATSLSSPSGWPDGPP